MLPVAAFAAFYIPHQFFKLHKQMQQLSLNNQMYWKIDFILSTNSQEYLNMGLECWRHTAEHKVGDELIGKRGWWRWMPPLVIRIRTSVIHLTTSHCTDPVTCTESPGCSPLLSACSLSVVREPLSLFRFLPPHGAHQHQEQINCISA